MAIVLVKFTLGNGATGGYIKIDRKGVKLVNGRGEAEVDASKPHHTVTLWFEGASGGTLEYELSENLGTLVKGKVSISFGQVEGVVSGQFKLKSVA
jgi:hypothetical protein